MAYTGGASLTQAACKGIIRPRNRYATVDDTLLAERIQQADKEWAKALTNALRQEAAAWQGLLRGWQLYALLVFFALGLLIVPQLPLRYQIDVGIGEGYGGDLPLLRGFNDAEFDDHGTYRWTNDYAQIQLPGVGARSYALRLSFFPIGGIVVEQGPKEIELWSQERRFAVLPIRPEGVTYTVGIPADLLSDGNLALTIRTTTFSPGGDDPRELGTPLDKIELIALDEQGFVAPSWRSSALWLLSALLVWAIVLRAGFRPMPAFWPVLALACLALIAAYCDPARFAFGAGAALRAALYSYVLLLALRALLPWAAQRLELPLNERALSWLLLIIVFAFGMRYGGRLFPSSMHGDINFHFNRMTEVIKGRVFLLSRNRGVDFPYPPGPYLALAPFSVLGIEIRTILQLGAAIVDSVSAACVYAITATLVNWRRGAKALYGTPLLAAGLYVFTAAGFMTTWWSFDTHIYTQFVSVVFTTTLVLMARNWSQAPARKPSGGELALLFLLLVGVFLGHFGFFINTVLLGGGLLALLWLQRWRGNQWATKSALPLSLTYVGAGLSAALLFYSAFMPLFLSQLEATASGGLTGLAQRAPVPRSVLWDTLWDAGFIVHFGFFPLVLAPLGLLAYYLFNRQAASAEPQAAIALPTILIAILGGSFLVSSIFAILPFITLSTQSTRWLMFSAWAVAVLGAFAMTLLWKLGRAGKLVVIAMLGFVAWNTASQWLGALAWRIRPPEPF